MANTTLRKLHRFPQLFLHKKSRILRCAGRWSTNSSGNQTENEDSEDFFGIPSGFRLQQKRLEHLDIEHGYFGSTDKSSSNTRSRSQLKFRGPTSQQDLDLDTSLKKTPQSPSNYEGKKFRSERASPKADTKNVNIFDKQYFEGALEQEDRNFTTKKSEQTHINSPDEKSPTDPNLARSRSKSNFIEDQYFGETQTGSDISSLGSIYLPSHKGEPSDNPHHDNPGFVNTMHDVYGDRSNLYDKASRLEKPGSRNPVDQPHLHMKSWKENSGTIQTEKEPFTAYDMALKVRQELKNKRKPLVDTHDTIAFDANLTIHDHEDSKVTGSREKRDSMGYPILSDQLLDLSMMTSSDIITMLRKKIVFDHEDFLAIDKPYGLPSVDHNNSRLSLNHLLPKLSRSLPSKYQASHLQLVQGLDKDVTGTVILAKNEEAAHLLQGMFNSNEIIQRYWAITKGVPNPRAGVVDIPIGQAKVANHFKMVLRPLYSRDLQFQKRTSKAPSFEAVTEFKVLASHQEVALVECQPQKKLVRHQVRVHLANGLNTPILGDHKYSHFSKLAPQKLDRSTLELLNVRQAKVRHLALHLHCLAIVIPHYKSRMVFIKSKLPPHFVRNMKSLKLSVPRK